jgi:hypothetical protein
LEWRNAQKVLVKWGLLNASRKEDLMFHKWYTGHPEMEIESDGTDIFIKIAGVRVAKRGHPGTPQAKTWVSIEPGWRALDGPKLKTIVVEYNGVTVQ